MIAFLFPGQGAQKVGMGQALAELKVEVDVPEDIPWLGIKRGRIDVQRFFYWAVAKMFWNEALGFEENHHVNFDWYHPRYAHRQTEGQVRGWCGEAGRLRGLTTARSIPSSHASARPATGTSTFGREVARPEGCFEGSTSA